MTGLQGGEHVALMCVLLEMLALSGRLVCLYNVFEEERLVKCRLEHTRLEASRLNRFLVQRTVLPIKNVMSWLELNVRGLGCLFTLMEDIHGL